MTIRCVDSIFQTCTQPYTIYIVDNGSTNDSYQQLMEQYQNHDKVKVIKAENLGYAIGNNHGMREAIKDGHDIITVTNNDVIFEEDSIANMYKFLEEHKDVAVAAPYILSPEGELQNLPTLKPISKKDYLLYNTKINKFASLKNKINFEHKYYLSSSDIKNDPIPIYKFSGCCFMARSELLESIGLFDENTFLYYEEDILSHKMYKAGLTSFYLPNAKIVHHHGLTTGKDNLFVDTEMLKSEIYFLSSVYKVNYFFLLFIYLDRALTPIMKKVKKTYSLSFKQYQAFLSKTWAHLKRYT